MANTIQEYLVALGFKVDDLATKRFNETLEGLGKNFLSMGEQAKASAFQVGLAVDKMASNYESLYYLSQRTGATVQNLQATAFGFAQVGLQASDAKGMIDALALSLKFNPGTNTILSTLHVGPGDANTRALGALHALRNLNPILQQGFGGMLGMNEYQLSMLLAPGALEKIESAGADLKRRQNQAGFDPDKLAKNSVEFENSMRLLQDELGVVGDRIKADLIGPMKTFVDLLEKHVETWGKLLGTKGAVMDPAGILPAIGNAWQASKDWLGGGTLGWGLSVRNTLAGEDSPAGRQRRAATGGAAADQAAREAYIRQRALVYGIDPDVAVRVARSEGLNNLADSQGGLGDNGTSGGDFQLHIGGGLGDAFRSATGLDPLDPRNWQAADDFALRMAAQGDWTPWHGAARVGIGAHEGIGASAPLGSDSARGGGGGDYHIGAGSTTTFNITGGSDPQTTADYVLKGQMGVWDNIFRNAGTGVR